jgi:hypothetical protein
MSRRTTVSEELLVSPYWTRNMPAAVRVVAVTGMCSQSIHGGGCGVAAHREYRDGGGREGGG